MPRRAIIIIFRIVLLGLNVFFFIQVRQKTAARARAHTFLISDGVIEFVDDRRNHFHTMIWRSGEPELASSSKRFLENVDSLRLQIKKSSAPPDPAAYFTQRISIDPKTRSSLLASFQAFDQAINTNLADLAGAHQMFVNLRDDAHARFDVLQAKANASTPGIHSTAFEFKFDVEHRFSGTLVWTKKGDSVKWHDDLGLFVNYMERLDRKANTTTARQVKRMVDKMADIFSVPGKLHVYGQIYDLSNTTEAEVNSICKYLYLIHTEVEECIARANNDKYFF